MIWSLRKGVRIERGIFTARAPTTVANDLAGPPYTADVKPNAATMTNMHITREFIIFALFDCDARWRI